jgi:TonB family protein
MKRFKMQAAAACFCVMALLLPSNSNGSQDPDSDLNLRDLINHGVDAARKNDQSTLKQIASDLMIPNYGGWFKNTFGDEVGGRFANSYKSTFDRTQEWLPKLFEALASQEGELIIDNASDLPNDRAGGCGRSLVMASHQQATFYRVAIVKRESSGTATGTGAGYFARIEGRFRRLDCKTLGLQDGATQPANEGSKGTEVSPSGSNSRRPARVRMGGQVAASKIIHRVPPHYPELAKARQLSGTVRMHVIVGISGAVQEVEVLSGDPLLASAAVEAVRQWTYKVMTLNGEPVEVDTTVDLIFSLAF